MIDGSKAAQTLKSFAHFFYKTHKKTLEENYPGLTLRVFFNILNDFAKEVFSGQKNALENFYSAGLNVELDQFFKKTIRGIPFEYILSHSFFYKAEFFVNRDILIPRSETETLVELAIKELKENQSSFGKKALRVVDVGTGSGAILLSVLKDSPIPLEAFATDISSKALQVAKINAFRLRWSFSPVHKLTFLECDRLTELDFKFDLIVSNPPYIKKESDKNLVHKQVATYEPELALYLDDQDYEQWYIDFFGDVYKKLTSHGKFIMEGHENHLERLADLSKIVGFSKSCLHKDLTGATRFLSLQL